MDCRGRPNTPPLLIPAPPSPATSNSSIVTAPDNIETNKAELYEGFETFKATGGRPSREIDDDPGHCPTPTRENTSLDGECYHCYDHWANQCCRFYPEWNAWEGFLDFRTKWRAPDKFAQYKESTLRHMQEQGISWNIELEPGRQTKLDEWREFHIYWLGRKVGYCRKRQAKAQQELDRLAKLPPEEVAEEARDRTADARSWEDYWRRAARDVARLLPWIEGEFPKIQEELAAASLEQARQKRRRGAGTRWSGRLREELPPVLPMLPVRPTRVFKSRRRRGLRAKVTDFVHLKM